MKQLSFAGLALATSISAIVNFSLLYYYSHKKAPAPDRLGLARYSANILFAAGLSGLGAFGIMRLLQRPDGFGGLGGSLIAVTATFFAAASIYLIICRLFGVDELRQMMRLFSRKPAPSAAGNDISKRGDS